MRSERVDEMLLVRYLLGELTEEEQVRVEDRTPNYRMDLPGRGRRLALGWHDRVAAGMVS